MTEPAQGISITTSFYTTSPYFDICKINETKFAIFNKPVDIDNKLSIILRDCHIIILSPIEAKLGISIKALSVFNLSNLGSKKGLIEIKTSWQCILMRNIRNIEETQIERITQIFHEGISKRNSVIIFQALCSMLVVIKDSPVKLTKICKFFNIPL